MKTTILPRLFTMLFASAIFFGCSKEQLPVNSKSNETISSGKMGPVYNAGVITGLLSPAPAAAEIKVYNDDGSFSIAITPSPDGRFWIDNIPEGLYHLYISYIPGGSPADYYFYFKVPNVKVIQGNVTDLGKIILP